MVQPVSQEVLVPTGSQDLLELLDQMEAQERQVIPEPREHLD